MTDAERAPECPPHSWVVDPEGSGLRTYGKRCSRCPAVAAMPGELVKRLPGAG
mgnify:CR=1 FL=1